MNKKTEKKLKEFGEWLVSPLGTIVAVVILIAIILVVVSVNLVRKTIIDGEAEWLYEEYDPASDTIMKVMAPTNDESDGPDYVGFNVLFDNGVTSAQFALFKDAVSGYAASKEMELTRVSYLKDSYSLAASYVFDFKVVLNKDQETLKVRIDSSAGWKDVMGAKVELWNENGDLVFELSVDDSNICNYFSDAECGDN